MLVVGEALVDVVVTDAGEVDAPGGSPLNVAVGMARLGTPATLLTQLGDDARGALLRDHLAANHVELLAEPTTTGHTSVATARLDPAGVASYDFDLEWTLPPRPLPPVEGLHVGSLGATLPPGRDAVRRLVDEAAARNTFVSYDPNLRPQFVAPDSPLDAWVLALADRACVVKLSEEDCELLDPGARPDEVARTLLGGGRTELVFLTRGGEGATAYHRDAVVEAPAPRVEVVDTVGAGDSFMAAVLAQLDELDVVGDLDRLTGAMVQQVVRGASVVAAVTCSRRGAAPPWRRELPSGWPA